MLSALKTDIFGTLRQEIDSNDDLCSFRTRILNGTEGDKWSVQDGLILYTGRAYLPPDSALIDKIVSEVHDATHEGTQKTRERIRLDFYWKGWKTTIQDYVRACVVCQRNKWETLQPAGLLQPLPIPSSIWADISMDFVDALPKVSETIVSDRYKVFQSAFWKELFRLSGSKLSFSTAYHPQSDGQTEVVNRTIEMYMRCLTGDKPRKWLSWLPWAEYCYNTSYHTALKTTPFKLVYGRDPPRLLNYIAGNSKVEAVDQALVDRTEFLKEARNRLLEAQNRMKTVYDNHHRLLEFQVGDWVWLKLQPYRQLSVSKSSFTKLSPKFYGPFPVLQRVGQVAYRLQLPDGSRIHNVFHVSLLKPHRGPPPTSVTELPPLLDGRTLLSPFKVLRDRWLDGRQEVLVQWAQKGEESATWEDKTLFANAYPDFELADKLNEEEGSNVMHNKYGKVYQRRSKG